MNFLAKWFLPAVILTAMPIGSTFAQEGPPPGGPDGGGPPPQRRDDDRPPPPPDDRRGGDDQDRPPGPPRDGQRGGPHDRDGGPRDHDDRRGPGGQGGPGGPGGGPGGNRPPPPIDQMRGYLEVVDRYAKLSHDPASAGVAAVMSAKDLLRNKGPQGAIDYFNKILPDVKNDTVARAIRLQLVDLYRATNQPDKALEQVTSLITSVPAGDAASQTSAPAPR